MRRRLGAAAIGAETVKLAPVARSGGAVAIAPVAGWTWFPEQTNPVVQLLAHAFFFGAPVGWYVGVRAR